MFIVLKENPQVKPNDYIFYRPVNGMSPEEIEDDLSFISLKLFNKPIMNDKGIGGSNSTKDLNDALLLNLLRDLQMEDK